MSFNSEHSVIQIINKLLTAFNPCHFAVPVSSELDVSYRTAMPLTWSFFCSPFHSINGWSIPITCSEPWRWDSCGAGRELLCCTALWWVIHWCFPALALLNSVSSSSVWCLSSTMVRFLTRTTLCLCLSNPTDGFVWFLFWTLCVLLSTMTKHHKDT